MRFRVEQTKDGSSTLFDAKFGECYKSRHAANTEVDAVFFAPGVRENPWLNASKQFRILELGLGLGTNLHQAAKIAESLPNNEIEFFTIERDLAGAEKFIEEGLAGQELRELVNRKEFKRENFSATLMVGEFEPVLQKLKASGESFHAIFFDPFSPKSNPEAWQPPIFQLAADLLFPEARLVSYSVSRIAKDGCAQAGLEVHKIRLPEILNKRSALLAIKPKRIENRP